MPLNLTFPATSENYSIVGRMTNDNNLSAIRATSFTLRRASDGGLISRNITIGNATRARDGTYYWDITVVNNDSYNGLVYVQIAAFSFFDSGAGSVVPTSVLNSNQFQYNTMAIPAPAAPTNASGSTTDTTATLTWDSTPGKTYEIRQGSNAWEDATSPYTASGLSPETAYTFEVREKASGSTPAGNAASVSVTTMSTPTIPRPDAPTGLAGTAAIDTASLTWNLVRGQTYEIRRDGGAWGDATSPYTASGLQPDTTYRWDVRIKASGSTPAGNIASLSLKTRVRPVGPLSIESIDPQFIVVGTKNYVLEIDIGGNPTSVDPTGNMEGFDHTWNATLGKLYIRAVNVERLVVGAIWKITISRGSDTLEAEILYNVIPPGLIFHDLDLIHLYKDVPINYNVMMENIPSLVLPTARLLGLKADVIDTGVWVYGKIPEDSVFTDVTGEVLITAPLETGDVLEKRYPYQVEEGDPPLMNMPTFTPHGNYGLLDFDPVTHALGYEWTLGDVNADTVWNDTRPVVDPSQIEVTPGNLEVSLKFPIVPMASSYEYRLDSETHTVEWTAFQGKLQNGFITVIIPNLEEGEEYDLQIRVASPWIGTPVTIKIFGGRTCYSLQYVSRDRGNQWFYIFHTGQPDGGVANRVKRLLLPSALTNFERAGLAVNGDGDVFIPNYVPGNGNEKAIYVFLASTIANTPDGSRLTQDRKHPLPTDFNTYNSPNATGLAEYNGELYTFFSSSPSSHRYFVVWDIPQNDGARLTRVRGSTTQNVSSSRSGFTIDSQTIYVGQRSGSFNILNTFDKDLYTYVRAISMVDKNNQRISFGEGIKVIGNNVFYATNRSSDKFFVYGLPDENSDPSRLVTKKSFGLPSGLNNAYFLDSPT